MTKDFKWDWLVRLTHWSVAILFISNYTINQAGGTIHIWFGSAILALVGIRLIWGLVTHSPARLSAFPPNPIAAIEHIRQVFVTKKDDHEGHNPAGAIMIWCLWLGLLTTGISGWMIEQHAFDGAFWVMDLHETLANITLILACLHVLAIGFMSHLTGNKYLKTMSLRK